MYAKLRAMNYPRKLSALLVIILVAVVSTVWAIRVQLPSGAPAYRFVSWNMLLAWIPVIFAVLLDVGYASRKGLLRTVYLWLAGAIWLFFYPNTPYLITDMLHVVRQPWVAEGRFWMEMIFWSHLLPMMLVGFCGIMLGYFSLESVRQLVRYSYGVLISWTVTFIVLGLTSVGIYLGRFLRANTWDMVTDPVLLYQQISSLWADAEAANHFMSGAGMFFLFLVTCYMFIWAVSHSGRTAEHRSLHL